MLLTAGLAFDVSPWLRGDLDWRWPYSAPVFSLRLGLVLLLLALYIGVAARLWKRTTNDNAGWVVAYAVVAGLLIQVLAQLIVDEDPLRQLILRTGSTDIGGYFDVATFYYSNTGDFLRQFPQNAPGWNVHPQRHPPGLILYYAGLQRVFARLPALTGPILGLVNPYRCEYQPLVAISDTQYAAVIGGLLSPLLTVLSLIPMYVIGRRLLGQRAALGAVLISPLLPGYVLWAGVWDQAFVMVTVLMLWLLYTALVERRHWAWWVMGGLLSVASFFTHAMLVLLGFIGIYTLFNLWLGRDYWRSRWRQLLLNGIGFALMLGSVWLVYWLLFDVTFLEVYRANTTPHFAVSTHYFSRLFYNSYDFILFLGFAPALVGVVAVWQVLRARGKRSELSQVQILVLAFALTMVVLVVSGVSRAEVGRVWVFLMPLATLAAFAAKDGPSHSPGRWLMTAALIALQTVVLQATINDYLTPRIKSIERSEQMPESATALGSQIGDSIQLAGFEVDKLEMRPGETLNVTLYWRSVRQPHEPYVAFVHVFEAQQGFAGQLDSPPRRGEYPTFCWQRGEVVQDDISITIEAEATPGDYELLVGMYTRPDAQRLPTSGPGARDFAVLLTEIRVLP